MKDLKHMTIGELGALLKSRKISSCEITKYFLDEINRNDGRIGAYITVSETALSQAEKADEILKNGGGTVLTGIPMALKDNISVKGMPLTCASKMLEDYISPYDAGVWERLKNQGAVLLGKTNMDEFAMGSSCENSAIKRTVNPLNEKLSPGGSSGGSAAAVASGEAVYALGSDTGGSVRQPAAFCGLVGMKPTYSSVSRYGLVAFASSMDQIGPLTRTVGDNAAVFRAISGCDHRDSTSTDGYTLINIASNNYVREKLQSKSFKIGLVREFMGKAPNMEIDAAVYSAAKALENIGSDIVEISLPNFKYALPSYYVISSAEASSNLARYDGVRYGHRSKNFKDINELMVNSRSEAFGEEVKRRIMTGTFVLSAGYQKKYYSAAVKGRNLIKKDYADAFSECDVIIAPVTPSSAFPLGTHANPMEMYREDIYTVSANLAGIPALTVPWSKSGGGMPIGIQIMGPQFSEETLYSLGEILEEVRDNAI